MRERLICLALILATRDYPARAPEMYEGGEPLVRKKMASLADMAASCATRLSVPWKLFFGASETQFGYEFSRCVKALQRNPGYYCRPASKVRRLRRHPNQYVARPDTIYLSPATIVVVPNNLLAQWRQEIAKHTKGLEVLVLTRNDPELPAPRSAVFTGERHGLVLAITIRKDCEAGRGHQPVSSVLAPLQALNCRRGAQARQLQD